MEKGKKIKNKKTSKKKAITQSPVAPKDNEVSKERQVTPIPKKKGKPSNKNKGK